MQIKDNRRKVYNIAFNYNERISKKVNVMILQLIIKQEERKKKHYNFTVGYYKRKQNKKNAKEKKAL